MIKYKGKLTFKPNEILQLNMWKEIQNKLEEPEDSLIYELAKELDNGLDKYHISYKDFILDLMNRDIESLKRWTKCDSSSIQYKDCDDHDITYELDVYFDIDNFFRHYGIAV